MKKPIVLAALLFPSFAFSQDSYDEGLHRYVYCQITRLEMAHKVTLTVDFGRQTNALSKSYLTDEFGDPIELSNMVDAINHMAERGWWFVQAFATSTSDQITDYCLMRKPYAELSKEERNVYQKK